MPEHDTNTRMTTNNTNTRKPRLFYPKLSYKITGLLFTVHNELGRNCREKQYADALESTLKENSISYVRERELPMKKVDNKFTNKVDFEIDKKILVEIKAKRLITKEDYYQINRYLDAGGHKLGMIVNFRNKYLKPIRVIRANS